MEFSIKGPDPASQHLNGKTSTTKVVVEAHGHILILGVATVLGMVTVQRMVILQRMVNNC